MKQLLDTPSTQASPARIADFAELLAIKAADKNVSVQDIVSALKRTGEGEEDEEFERPVEEAFEELAARRQHTGGANALDPFEIDGDLLKLKKAKANTDHDLLYVFLLLATRLNMLTEKTQAGLDGTQLFEFLCLEIAKRYWGASSKDALIASRVHGTIFGTSRATWRSDPASKFKPTKFQDAVTDLCRDLGEGHRFRTKDQHDEVTANDDKLDVVVWRNFSDQRPAKLIGFGQCKTGDHWELELPRLNPATFCNRWLHDAPCVVPIKLFFLTDRVVERWKTRCYEAGILFDRCRIIDYADEVPANLVAQCATWTRAGLSSHDLSW